jgi:MFS family permease
METPKPDAAFANVVRALRHRNYRLFFVGQGISLVGTWLTRVAMSWLVYRLTGSALVLGVVGFASQMPTFLVAPFAGVLVDRWSRHRVLVVTQALAMLQSALLAASVFSGTTRVWHLLVLGAFQGFVNAFDTPARQAFVVEMVDARADLANAIALNSSMVNGARLIGPSVAGILIAAFGEGWCFAIDAFSYVAVLASLLAMRIASRARPATHLRVMAELRDGFSYVKNVIPIRAILLLLALVSLVGVPYSVLLPIIAGKTLHGGANTLGLLTGASGVGAVVAALWLASRRSVLGLGRVICIAGATFGTALIAFSASRRLGLSLALMVITGGGMMILLSASNTLLQTLVDDDKRGRVMSFFTMAFFGMMPLGSLVAGFAGDRIGAPATIAWGGAATLVAVATFARKLPELRRLAHPIYVRRGIIPEVALGLRETDEMLAPSEK